MPVLERDMSEELNRFEGIFSELREREFWLVMIRFNIEDERAALEIAHDIALLEGTELIYCSKA